MEFENCEIQFCQMWNSWGSLNHGWKNLVQAKLLTQSKHIYKMNETWREKNLYIKKKRYTLKLISLYIYLNQEIIEIK